MNDYFATYGRGKEVRGRLSSPSLRRTVLFAVQSIRVRLGRCAITTVSVVCAIAFLTYNILALEHFWRRAEIEATAAAAGVAAPAAEPAGDVFARLELYTGEKSAEQKILFVTTLSLLVCLAGITNSMMMSIKERFREIATLKCLGAVNSYVTRLFLIEAVLQGGLGSLAGILLGLGLFRFGHGGLPALGYTAAAAAGCFVLGAAMTLVASVWPIRTALAMMPIDALRVVE